MSQHVTFKVRGQEDRWLIVKKKVSPITRQEIADCYCDKFDTHAIWAADIEEMRIVEDKDAIKKLFTTIQDTKMLFL